MPLDLNTVDARAKPWHDGVWGESWRVDSVGPRQALFAFLARKGDRIFAVEEKDGPPAFSREEPAKHLSGEKEEPVDERFWTEKDVPEGTPPRCAKDDAVVTFYDVYTPPTLTKSVVGASCLVDVEYEVVVKNPSDLDTLTVNTLTDDRFGDVTATHAAIDGVPGVEAVTKTDCPPLPVDVGPLGELRCKFTGQIASPTCNLSHTNEVTSSVKDEGAPLPRDSSIRSLDDVVRSNANKAWMPSRLSRRASSRLRLAP